ncbi:MAG: efflux RND transporter periplasmic adaptor subunit [Anaerolineales bacterium]
MKKLLVFSLMIFSLLLTACAAPQATPVPAQTASPSLVIAEGHILPLQDVKLSFSARGKVQEILAQEGQIVRAGDPLLRLADSEQASAALAAANFELTQAQQAYDDFLRNEALFRAQAWEAYLQAQTARAAAQIAWEKVNPNAIQDQIDTADADASDKKKLMDDAQTELDKYKDLKSDNPTRRSAEDALRTAQANYNDALRKSEDLHRQVDAPRAALDAALAAEAEALRKYSAQKDGPDPDQKALLEARLNNAKAQLAAAQNALDSYTIKAPFGGTLTDVNVSLGQLVGPETWAVQLADLGAWTVETSDLTELEVVKISVGQTVEIRPDALDTLTLTGVVDSISQSSKTQGGDVLYTVKIKLNDSDPALRWGMTVQVTFP